MPSDRQMRVMNAVHRGLIRASRNRLGWRLYGMPAIELTTVGRRSGEPRSSMLTCPLHDGATYVIVASRGGDPHHPAWFLNLRDEPQVQVRSGRAPARPMRARIATGDEHDELWARIAATKPHYLGYQDKTDRVIPLVVLEPVD